MSAKTGRPYKENAKTCHLSCGVSSEMFKRIKKYSLKHERTVSSIIAEALEKYLDEVEKQDKT